MWATPIIAIGAIFILEGLALWQHINGAALAVSFTAIGSIATWVIKGRIERRRKK